MAKLTKLPAPDHLTMQLFAPGMSLRHRAGLGALACTLKAMEQQNEAGSLPKSKLPAPFNGDAPPWDIDEQSVTLRFGKPENAAEYLKKLFAFAFQINKDGLIYLPGQYGDITPPLEVLAALQDGIQNTFLQHGPTCGSRSGDRTVTIEINETPIPLTYDVFTSYKHQGWFWLDRDEKSKEKDPVTGKRLKTGRRVQLHQSFPAVCDSGILSRELHQIDNKLFPGGIVRHDRFSESAISETDAGLICLHFSLVGCLTLSVNRVTAVLLIPEIRDILAFCQSRPLLTPRSAKECRIAGAADAALQAQVRIRARRTADEIEIPACYAITCRPTQWNKKQKPRVATILVPTGSDRTLDRFERALTWLSPRLVIPEAPAPKRSKRVGKAKQPEPRWADSIVRPLIAENLALGRPWYRGFVDLVTKKNPATGKPYRNQLGFEKGGLHAMTADREMWDDEGESLVVKAVHEAIRYSLGRIKEETDGAGNKPPSRATKNRWTKFRETLRIALSGAKTANDARHALCDLFSRAGRVPALVDGWHAVLPKLADCRWQLTRDLALLALASYAGRADSNDNQQPETK